MGLDSTILSRFTKACRGVDNLAELGNGLDRGSRTPRYITVLGQCITNRTGGRPPTRLEVSERQHHLGLCNDMILPQWANGGPDREELSRMPTPLMRK